MNPIEKYQKDIRELCIDHDVKTLYAFGSVLTNDFTSSSDIDLIVNFDDIKLEDYANNYFSLKFSLEDLLKRPVDLLEEKTLKNHYVSKSIEKQRQLIYG